MGGLGPVRPALRVQSAVSAVSNTAAIRRFLFSEDSYALVFLLALAAIVTGITAPDDPVVLLVSNVVYFVAAGVALWTSSSTSPLLRARVLVPVGVVLLVAIGVAAAVDSDGLAAVLGALLILLIGATVCFDLARHGDPSWQNALGVLTLYLLLGVLFASLYSVVVAFGDSPFFSNGSNGTLSDRLYFSFATLTTTGYGDFAPATGAGRALATVEAVGGELFLVTAVAVAITRITRVRVERAIERRG